MLKILVTKGGLVSAVRWHHITTDSGIGRLLQHKSGAVPIKAHSSHRMPRDGRLRRAAPCRQLSVGMRTVFCRSSDYFLRGK